MVKEIVKYIIIISGPVASGKTTVAREIVKSYPGPLVYIEGDKFWPFMVKGLECEGRLKNFNAIMTAMTAAALAYALSGYQVILDFSIPPWFLDTILKMTHKRDVSLEYVVLRPSEKVCAMRAAGRTEGTITDYTPFHKLYLSFEKADQNAVDDDTTDVAEFAELVKKGLTAGIFRILG